MKEVEGKERKNNNKFLLFFHIFGKNIKFEKPKKFKIGMKGAR